MKITGFQLAKISVPLITPFKTALRSVNSIEDIILMVETDTGHIGYGEAPATAVITGDTLGSIQDALRLHILPALIGMSIDDLEAMTGIIQNALVHNTNAKAAAEIAIYDLHAQSKDLPLYQFLGGGVTRLVTGITISVGNTEQMVADSLRAIKNGYETLKIKVGKDIDQDIDDIKKIAAVCEGKARLILDANQGWTAEQTVRALEELESAGVEIDLIEQPVPANDIEGLSFVTNRVKTPVMADESAFNQDQVTEILKRRAADIINIKLMKAGGISNASQIAEIAQNYGIKCMIGCMLETSISIAAAAHFAVSRANIITRIDLDGVGLSAFDPVVGGATFNGPEIILSDAPGLDIQSVNGLQKVVC